MTSDVDERWFCFKLGWVCISACLELGIGPGVVVGFGFKLDCDCGLGCFDVELEGEVKLVEGEGADGCLKCDSCGLRGDSVGGGPIISALSAVGNTRAVAVVVPATGCIVASEGCPVEAVSSVSISLASASAVESRTSISDMAWRRAVPFSSIERRKRSSSLHSCSSVPSHRHRSYEIRETRTRYSLAFMASFINRTVSCISAHIPHSPGTTPVHRPAGLPVDLP